MPTPMFCSPEQVHARVARGLHVAPESLAAEWLGICADGARDAACEIENIFVLKGYTVAQLGACEMVKQWNSRLGAFFAYCNGTHLGGYDLKSVEHLDCRKEMSEAAALVIGGVAVAPIPGGSDVGGVSAGRLDAVADAERRFSRWFD